MQLKELSWAYIIFTFAEVLALWWVKRWMLILIGLIWGKMIVWGWINLSFLYKWFNDISSIGAWMRSYRPGLYRWTGKGKLLVIPVCLAEPSPVQQEKRLVRLSSSSEGHHTSYSAEWGWNEDQGAPKSVCDYSRIHSVSKKSSESCWPRRFSLPS